VIEVKSKTAAKKEGEKSSKKSNCARYEKKEDKKSRSKNKGYNGRLFIFEREATNEKKRDEDGGRE